MPLFVVAIVAGFLLSNQCPYVYGYSQIETARQNESQIAETRVNETFGAQNVMALIVPKGTTPAKKPCWNGWSVTTKWTTPWGCPTWRPWTAICSPIH